MDIFSRTDRNRIERVVRATLDTPSMLDTLSRSRTTASPRRTHLEVIMPTGKRVEEYPNGPVATGDPLLTVHVRESPHFLNAANFRGIISFRAAVMQAAQGGPSEAVDQLTHLQGLLDEQDGRNALLDDRELAIPPEDDATTVVVLWGGWNPFRASIELARHIRAAYPKAYLISASCEHEFEELKQPLLRAASEEGVIDQWFVVSKCSGRAAMRAFLETFLAGWRERTTPRTSV